MWCNDCHCDVNYGHNIISFFRSCAMFGNTIKASLSGLDVAGATILLNNMILTHGFVFAYSAFIRSNKPVHFQIWRSVVNGTKDSYRLIGDTRVVPSVNNDREDVSIRYLAILLIQSIAVIVGSGISLCIEECELQSSDRGCQ